MKTFTLPDLGEGLEEAEIVHWHVAAGDHVTADQPLVSVETDKAVVEVPAPWSGTIAKTYGEPGETLRVGAPLADYAEGERADAGAVVGQLEADGEDTEARATPPAAKPQPATKHPAPAPASESAKSGAARAADTPKSGAARAADTPKSGAARAADTPKSGAARAAPAVRALAEELKVDLDRIEGTGPHGAILRADVQAAASGRTRPKPLGPEWQSLRGVRKAMARSMTAALSIPRATVTEEADVGHWPDDVPVTLVLVQAMVRALDREPALNAAYDGEREARRLNPDAAIGIAVDTADGLIVPVLRTADFPDPHDLRGELRRLVEGAQRRSLSPADLRGATITLSNFGAIGGLFAELVIVPPQVAILGAGRLRDGRLPLSLTFDHRAVNGGEAARFLSAIKTHLEQTD